MREKKEGEMRRRRETWLFQTFRKGCFGQQGGIPGILGSSKQEGYSYSRLEETLVPQQLQNALLAALLVTNHLQGSLRHIIPRKIEFFILKTGELLARRPQFDSRQWN
jgi:hypothetical protein